MICGKIYKGWSSGMRLLLIVCLSQIASARVEDDGYHLMKWPLPSLDMSAPEAFHNMYTSVAFYDEYQRDKNFTIQMYTYTAHQHVFGLTHITLVPRVRPYEYYLTDVRQVGPSKVAFMIRENSWGNKFDFWTTRLLAVDTNTDQIWKLQHDIVTHNPIIVPTVHNEQFDLFIDDDSTLCKIASRCRIRYDLSEIENSYIKPFELELDWPTVHITRLANGDLVASGFQNETFKFILIDGENGERYILHELLVDEPQHFKYVSNGLALCWTGARYRDPLHFDGSCHLYSPNKQLIFEKFVYYYYETITLLDVHAISGGDGILMIAKKDSCKNCQDLLLIKMYPDSPKNYLATEMTFENCTGDMSQWNIFKVTQIEENSIKIDVGCRNNNGYFFHHYIHEYDWSA